MGKLFPHGKPALEKIPFTDCLYLYFPLLVTVDLNVVFVLSEYRVLKPLF